MICCDVNVVVAALRSDHAHHSAARRSLEQARSVGATIGVPDFVLTSAVRLLTNSRIFADPNTSAGAIQGAQAFVAAPGNLLVGSPAIWSRFSILVESMSLRGNDIPDAALAAVVIENRAELLTFDRGFARFDGLRWRIPAS